MEVINKPETPPEERPAGQAPPTAKGWLYRGSESKIGFLAGRAAFVIVATMFVVMLVFSVFMLWVSMNEPYLQPYVINDHLLQDKIYLQVDGESNYRELIVVNQPGLYDQQEITHIPLGKSFKVIFTPKQLDVPENYYITYLDGPNANHEIEGGYTRQTKYIRDDKFYSLTVNPGAGAWPSGKYGIDSPAGGMFGGRVYAYFTVSESAK